MEKLFAIIALFRKGNAVADPVAWKMGGISSMALVPVLLALDRVASAFGHPLGINEQSAADIAVGLLAVVGIVSHVVSSDKVGLPARSADRPAGTGDTGDDGGATGQPLIPGSGGG